MNIHKHVIPIWTLIPSLTASTEASLTITAKQPRDWTVWYAVPFFLAPLAALIASFWTGPWVFGAGAGLAMVVVALRGYSLRVGLTPVSKVRWWLAAIAIGFFTWFSTATLPTAPGKSVGFLSLASAVTISIVAMALLMKVRLGGSSNVLVLGSRDQCILGPGGIAPKLLLPWRSARPLQGFSVCRWYQGTTGDAMLALVNLTDWRTKGTATNVCTIQVQMRDSMDRLLGYLANAMGAEGEGAARCTAEFSEWVAAEKEKLAKLIGCDVAFYLFRAGDLSSARELEGFRIAPAEAQPVPNGT